MTITRAIVALLLAALAAYLAVINWLCAIVSVRNQRKGIDKHSSMIPILSIILIGMAAPIYPFTPKWWMGLIPLLDLGNLNMLRLPYFLMKERQRVDTEQRPGRYRRKLRFQRNVMSTFGNEEYENSTHGCETQNDHDPDICALLLHGHSGCVR
jgi:hypothetical protein